MVRSHRTSGYWSCVQALFCIALLLSGLIQYYSFVTNLSFVSLAYGEQKSVDDLPARNSSNNGNQASVSAPAKATSNGQDNAFEQWAGPLRFSFVDSFWTDHAALGGIVSSTSSENVTAQPIPSATRQEAELVQGFRVPPNAPERGLDVEPSSAYIPVQGRIIATSTTVTGTPANSAASNASSNKTSEIIIIAGRAQDLNFNIANNNRNPITDIVVTLVPRSESVAILGDSKWTLHLLSPQSKASFSTRVFASESLIGSPISFDVGVQYISGDQVKSGSFSLGGNVIGEIRISVNDLAVRYVGDIPNLTGNLLNRGNTKALFTTIEMQSNPDRLNQSSLIPMTATPQYLGDLEHNSPLPFSIPLAVDRNDGSSSLATGDYPVSVRVRYSDELRNTHEVILNETVYYSPPVQTEKGPNPGFFGFSPSTSKSDTITNFALPLVFIFGAVVAAAVIIIIILRRHRSRTKKISRLMGGEKDSDEFEAASDEYLGSSSDDESSSKQ